jgi:hypothetical protein
VLNPLFDKAEIEVERHVILQEIGQALDTPDDIIFDWLQEVSLSRQASAARSLGRRSAGLGLRKRGLRGVHRRALRAGPDDPVGGGGRGP